MKAYLLAVLEFPAFYFICARVSLYESKMPRVLRGYGSEDPTVGPRQSPFVSIRESSHAWGAAEVSKNFLSSQHEELAQDLTRSMTSKAFVRPTRPTIVCTVNSAKTYILVKLSYQPIFPRPRS